MKQSPHFLVGDRGERLAIRYLRGIGYDILGADVRLGRDQIDIVAHDPTENALVFVEVKARSAFSLDFRPELNVDRRKKKAMMRAARRWVANHDYDGGYRMDVVCVAQGRVVNHMKELSWE